MPACARKRSPRTPPRLPRRSRDSDYAHQQLTRASQLARNDVASQQSLDQAQNDVATALADVAEAEADHAAAVAGPTYEQRTIADAQVKAATSALAVLERRLEKTMLHAPADGVVSVIVTEVGENIRAGQPVLVIAEAGKQWLSFNAREDTLHGLTVGATVNVARAGAGNLPAIVTELVPLGSFATWQAERAVGDHDRNTLRLRLRSARRRERFQAGHDDLGITLKSARISSAIAEAQLVVCVGRNGYLRFTCLAPRFSRGALYPLVTLPRSDWQAHQAESPLHEGADPDPL